MKSSSSALLLWGIWLHLSMQRRLQLGFLLIVMLLSGFAEVFSLAVVIPFISILTDPDRIWQLPIVQYVSVRIGILRPEQLLLPATLLFGIGALTSASVRLLNLWLNGKMSAVIGSDLSCETYRRTLNQPYSIQISRNTSTVINLNTSHINKTVASINAFLQFLTSLIVSVGLICALLLIDWLIALAALSMFGLAYTIIAIMTRRRLAANSIIIAENSRKQVKAIQEGLGAIRDVILDSSQDSFEKIFQRVDLPMRIAQAKSNFLLGAPRYGLEGLALFFLGFLALGITTQNNVNKLDTIAILGTLALACQRLLPALQQTYNCWGAIRSHNSAIINVLEILNQKMAVRMIMPKPLQFKQEIKLQKLGFKYSPKAPKVLVNIELKIKPAERIGFIGTTGSGKSTLIDLLMGLLVPTDGLIVIDENNLHDPSQPEHLPRWRASIAHVPQSIYLSATSIAENIAFGIPKETIDMQRVKKAAQTAQIASFIESCSDGYETFVGERGICLSGGQCQRIGIARALYKNTNILILDEATSALDTSTENAIMQSINVLNSDLTVLVIAHRFSTLSQCGKIYELKDGRLLIRNPETLMPKEGHEKH